MKLTTKGRYAVMAVVDLASMRAGRPVPLAEIAERQDISMSYLEQLFARLKRGGIVTSVRGPGGGYMLAAPAGAISVAEVVKAVEDNHGGLRCAPTAPHECHGSGGPKCNTHGLWHMLAQEMERVLASVSLADVCQGQLGPRGWTAELRVAGDD